MNLVDQRQYLKDLGMMDHEIEILTTNDLSKQDLHTLWMAVDRKFDLIDKRNREPEQNKLPSFSHLVQVKSEGQPYDQWAPIRLPKKSKKKVEVN